MPKPVLTHCASPWCAGMAVTNRSHQIPPEDAGTVCHRSSLRALRWAMSKPPADSKKQSLAFPRRAGTALLFYTAWPCWTPPQDHFEVRACSICPITKQNVLADMSLTDRVDPASCSSTCDVVGSSNPKSKFRCHYMIS